MSMKPDIKLLVCFVGIVIIIIIWLIPKGEDSVTLAECTPAPYLPFAAVAAGSYTVPIEWSAWTSKAGFAIRIETPYQIMRREISVADVHHYMDDIYKKLSIDSTALREQYRNVLNSPPRTPFYKTSRIFAGELAELLSTATRCRYRLPEYDEWLAALVVYGDEDRIQGSKPARPGPMEREAMPEPDRVYDLLGNLREWSSSGCETGEFGNLLVGGDYLTMPEKLEERPCDDGSFYTAGFRLVMLGS